MKTRHYLKAFEVAKLLLEHPDYKVGIRTTGEYKHSPVNSVEVREWDANDNGLLITSTAGGKWILLDAVEVKDDKV